MDCGCCCRIEFLCCWSCCCCCCIVLLEQVVGTWLGEGRSSDTVTGMLPRSAWKKVDEQSMLCFTWNLYFRLLMHHRCLRFSSFIYTNWAVQSEAQRKMQMNHNSVEERVRPNSPKQRQMREATNSFWHECCSKFQWPTLRRIYTHCLCIHFLYCGAFWKYFHRLTQLR